MAPECSAKVLSSIPMGRKAVVHLTENICVFNKVHSGISFSAAGHEFNADELTICIK